MWNYLKHVETHEYIDQWLVDAGLNHSWACLFLVCLPCCQCQRLCFSLFRRTLHWLKGWPKLSFTFIPRCTRMCHLVVSAVPDLFDFSIHFIFFLIISLITLLFLLPDTFNFHDVVDKYPAHLLLRTLAPLPRTSLPQVMSPTSTTSRRLMNTTPRNPRFPWWLPLRRRHHRQDAPWRVPKTSRSHWRRRPVVQSGVVSQSWQNGETRCLHLWLRSFKCPRNSETQLSKWTDEDSSKATKRADSRWLSSRDSKTRIPGRVRQKVFKSWVKRLSRKEKKFVDLIKETNDVEKIINFLMSNYWNKIGNFVKLMWKVSMRWKNWRSFRAPPSTLLREEDWSRIETLSLNSLARYRNYRMKFIARMIHEIFRMLN